ncbi:Hsp20/alpha crystallin family protein [Streptomyces sp. NPDC004561]
MSTSREHAHRQGRTPADSQGRQRSDGAVRAAAGVFTRQVVLADTLDTEHIEAAHEAGVLIRRVPIAERAKPRKISIGGSSERKQISG